MGPLEERLRINQERSERLRIRQEWEETRLLEQRINHNKDQVERMDKILKDPKISSKDKTILCGSIAGEDDTSEDSSSRSRATCDMYFKANEEAQALLKSDMTLPFIQGPINWILE